MRHREIQAAIRATSKAINDIEKITTVYPKRFKDELSDIGRSVIDEWYDSYNRKMYDPYGSLYYAYKVEVKKNIGTVRFSPNFIKHIHHNQSSFFVYNNSFLEGYHGGSYDKKNTFGEPHWRKPSPFFTEWGDVAQQSFSPYDKMHKEMQDKIDELQDNFNRDISDIQSYLSPHLNRLKGGL